MGIMSGREQLKSAFASDEQRWDAVVRRDRNADGHFYYSVRTTGVYCRPSCASRPPGARTSPSTPRAPDAERAGLPRPASAASPTSRRLPSSTRPWWPRPAA